MPSATAEEERTRIYGEGLALAQAQRWEEALVKFEQVVAIRSAPRALVALATAQEKTGRWTSAKRTYLKTEADARAMGDEELSLRATTAVASLEVLLPHVALRLPPGAERVAVTVDGSAVAENAGEFEIDPGEHRIVVAARGARPFEQTFQIAKGERKEIIAALTPLVEMPTTTTGPGLDTKADRANDAGLWPPVPVWILGGAGVTAIIVGLVVRANGQSDYDDASRACSNGRCGSADAVTRGNAGRDRMRAGAIVAGAGGVAVAGAGVWWALSGGRSNQVGDRSALSVGAHASADGCWVRLIGHF